VTTRSLSTSATARQDAHEIRRRLLPNSQATPNRSLGRQHASDGTAVAREQLAATVAAHLGVPR
jgi:hypothetical protein